MSMTIAMTAPRSESPFGETKQVVAVPRLSAMGPALVTVGDDRPTWTVLDLVASVLATVLGLVAFLLPITAGVMVSHELANVTSVSAEQHVPSSAQVVKVTPVGLTPASTVAAVPQAAPAR